MEVGTNFHKDIQVKDSFFGDETIEDIVRPKKQITAPQVVDLDPIPTPIVHNNQGR